MWNERYSVDEYIYGTEANSFLIEQAKILQGPVLSLAEGEGRNAVFMASLGLDVCGVDSSDVALNKAQKLAKLKGLEIKTEVADLKVYQPQANYYGSVVSIFAHLPSEIRKVLYPRIAESLKPGGVIVLEAYSEAQIAHNTGGPKDLDMLMKVEKIKKEFLNYEIILLREIEREVIEGTYHNGLASVVQFVGRKISLQSK